MGIAPHSRTLLYTVTLTARKRRTKNGERTMTTFELQYTSRRYAEAVENKAKHDRADARREADQALFAAMSSGNYAAIVTATVARGVK